jgi:hypothetical protein
MPKKEQAMKYEKVDRVSRWNYCQQISSLIYNSSISDQELQDILFNLSFDNIKIIFKKLKKTYE